MHQILHLIYGVFDDFCRAQITLLFDSTDAIIIKILLDRCFLIICSDQNKKYSKANESGKAAV